MQHKLLALVGCGILILLCMAGCGAAPVQRYTPGNLLVEEDFTQAFGWDTFTYRNIRVGVANGAYEMRSDSRDYVHGFSAYKISDIVVEVDARQFSTHRNNAYGIVCRGSLGDLAAGYYFLIGGDGSYSLRRGRGSDIEALVAWATTGAVHPGMDKNVLRAVCVQDYLALYVNGALVAEARDSHYASGFIGFVVAVSRGGTIDVAFDNLKIWEPKLQ